MNNLLEIRKGGDVKRFHTITMLREHLVSSHSWGVLTVILHVHPQASTNLLKAAVYHDVPEYETGDVAAPTKWSNPSLARELELVEDRVVDELGININLSPSEQMILKFSDMYDLILACVDEY